MKYNYYIQPFATYRHFLTHLQQTAFENILPKEKIAHDKQFLLLPKMKTFKLYSIIILSHIEVLHIFAEMFIKLSVADLLWKG